MKFRDIIGVLALLLFSLLPLPVWGTTGTLTITEDTTLTEDHIGNIIIGADGITLDGAGHTITGSGSGTGILLEGRTGVTVSNCIVTNFDYGFYLDSSTGNILEDNTASNNNNYGFYLDSSTGNILEDNWASNNDRGFLLQYSSGNTLQDNIVRNNGRGFVLRYSSGNILKENIVRNNWDGLHLFASSGNILKENIASNNNASAFLLLSSSDNNDLQDNTANNNVAGFSLGSSSDNTLQGNTANNNNDYGFYLDSSSDNTLQGNSASNNNYGFFHRSSSGNTIFHNNIIDNGVQAIDTNPAANDWHHPDLLEGNYWSDYPGIDDGGGTGRHAIAGDGIGDTLIPHPATDYDHYPFIGPIVIVSVELDVQPGVSDLVVDGKTIPAELFPSSFEWLQGTTHTITTPSTIVEGDPGVRYVFDGWSDGTKDPTKEITVTEDTELTAFFKTQYLLEILSDYGTPEGAGWYDSGTQVAIEVDSPLQVSEGTKAIFEGWTGDILSEERATSIIMDSPKTIVAEWKRQHFLTINADGGTVTGEGWYDEGSQAVAEATSPIDIVEGQSRLVFSGWSGDSTETSTQISLTMDSPKTVTANWKTQYYLTVGAGDGTATGEGWYDEGSTATASATTPSNVVEGQSRLVFTNWSGDSTETSPTVTITMDAPHAVTANWKIQYYLTIDPGVGEVREASQWIDQGSTITVSAISPSRIVEGESRQVFTGWGGASTSSEQTITLTMDTFKGLMANWKTQYYLTIDAGQGEVDKSSQWMDGGSVITVTAASPSKVVAEKSRFVFTGWSGAQTSEELVITLTIDSPKLLIANWQQAFYLKVNSELGDPQGEGWYESGETATFSATSPLGVVIQDVFDGWSGDAPIKTSEASIVMDSSKEVTASWRKDYTQLFIIVGVGGATATVSAIALRRRRSSPQVIPPTVHISTDKTIYAPGEKIEVAITITNPSKIAYPDSMLLVSITWPTGDGRDVSKYGPSELPPESSYTLKESLYTPDSMSVPDGTYEFTVTLTYNGGIATDTVSFTIQRT